MNNWFKRLYIWSLQLADTKWGTWILFICAFADASIFPLPITTVFLFLIHLNTKKTFNCIAFVVLGTITGALAGYSIGHYAWLNPQGEFTGLVQFLFNYIPGFSESVYNKIHILYAKWDIWILCGAALTPIPYGVFSISSGVFEINPLVFFIATMISQGIKFCLLALITIILGPKVKKLMEYNWKPLAIITTVCILIALLVINSV